MATDVVNRQRLTRIDANRIARVADATIVAVGRDGANLSVAFVRDRVMRKLNNKFRGIDKATDVLSFPAEEERETSSVVPFIGHGLSEHVGDVVISTDTALKQASAAGHSLAHEMDELVIHGVLHLCGYDHENDRGQMNRMELKLRKKLMRET